MKNQPLLYGIIGLLAGSLLTVLFVTNTVNTNNYGMMHGGMMGGQTSDIESLKNAANFDEAFLQEMIPHHQMAVMMAQMLLSGSNRPEMEQLGQDIITAQESEIEQMRSWLAEWSL